MIEVFDIIILGGGASGLSCAIELAPSGKRILIIEKSKKDGNDRTWSFWEKGTGKYDHILTNTWDKVNFYATQEQESVEIAPYQYKMLRSSDFYKEIHGQLKGFENVLYVNDEVLTFEEHSDKVEVKCVDASYTSALVLDGITIPKINPAHHTFVAQHFGGWFVEAEKEVFDPNTATFMDFRIPQEGDTRFFYVLPISSKVALVEIAIFSNNVEDLAYYDLHIEKYIKDYLKIDHYKIKEREIGVIPMTSYSFDKHNTERIFKIGTAGGWVKPSSGYAFKRIMKRSQLLAQQIIEGKKLDVSSKNMYKWLDHVMLKAILLEYVSGKKTFDSLFRKRKFQEIFKFLDEENNFAEDVKCMLSAPILPFIKAAVTP